jgi:hypothetical protein
MYYWCGFDDVLFLHDWRLFLHDWRLRVQLRQKGVLRRFCEFEISSFVCRGGGVEMEFALPLPCDLDDRIRVVQMSQGRSVPFLELATQTYQERGRRLLQSCQVDLARRRFVDYRRRHHDEHMERPLEFVQRQVRLELGHRRVQAVPRQLGWRRYTVLQETFHKLKRFEAPFEACMEVEHMVDRLPREQGLFGTDFGQRHGHN